MKKKIVLVITTLVVVGIVTANTGLTSKACQICEEAIAAGLDGLHVEEEGILTEETQEVLNEETIELVNPDNVVIPEGTDDESIEEFLNSLLEDSETPITEEEGTLEENETPVVGDGAIPENNETVITPDTEDGVVMPEIGDSEDSDTESTTNPDMEDTAAPDMDNEIVNPEIDTEIDPEFSQDSEENGNVESGTQDVPLQPESPEGIVRPEKPESGDNEETENKDEEEDKKEETGSKEETKEEDKKEETIPSSPVVPTTPIEPENKVDESVEDEKLETEPSIQENIIEADELLEPIDTKTGESKITTPAQKVKKSILENVKILTVNAKSNKSSRKSAENQVSIEQEVQLTGNMANIAEMEKSLDKAETNKNITKVEKKNNLKFVVTIVVALVIIVLGVFAGYYIIKKDSEEFLYENLEMENSK